MKKPLFFAAMRSFADAAYRLNQMWEQLEEDSIEYKSLNQTSLYPFEKSFDEICSDINHWFEDFEMKFDSYPTRILYGVCKGLESAFEKNWFYEIRIYPDRMEFQEANGRGFETFLWTNIDDVLKNFILIPKPLFTLYEKANGEGDQETEQALLETALAYNDRGGVTRV